MRWEQCFRPDMRRLQFGQQCHGRQKARAFIELRLHPYGKRSYAKCGFSVLASVEQQEIRSNTNLGILEEAESKQGVVKGKGMWTVSH